MNYVLFFLCLFYAVVNYVLMITMNCVLFYDCDLLEHLSLPGMLLFKYVFVVMSGFFFAFLAVLVFSDHLDRLTTSFCGLYFAGFTALLYYKIIVMAWYAESIDDFHPNFADLLMSFGSELTGMIKRPSSYIGAVYLNSAALLMSTPILGIVGLWCSYKHYCRLNERGEEQRGEEDSEERETKDEELVEDKPIEEEPVEEEPKKKEPVQQPNWVKKNYKKGKGRRHY